MSEVFFGFCRHKMPDGSTCSAQAMRIRRGKFMCDHHCSVIATVNGVVPSIKKSKIKRSKVVAISGRVTVGNSPGENRVLEELKYWLTVHKESSDKIHSLISKLVN